MFLAHFAQATQTYVAYNQYPANRQSYNWRNPNSFIPERFINPDPYDAISSLQPFGVGRHTCIGKNVAYSELRLTLTRLLWCFDLALADEDDRFDWGDQNTYIFWVRMKSTIRCQSVLMQV